MSRYILTEKIKKILEARGYGDIYICIDCGVQNKYKVKTCYKCGGEIERRRVGLICKICDCPLIAGLSEKEAKEENRLEAMGEEIESKQQRRGKSKLYHASCYDKSHLETDMAVTDEELDKFFSLPKKHKKMSHKSKKKQRKRKSRIKKGSK